MNRNQRLGAYQASSLADSIKLIIQPWDAETERHLVRLGFQGIPRINRLFYREMSRHHLSEVFLAIARQLSEMGQNRSRYCITRSALNSHNLLVEFLDAQPLSTITESVKHAWFLRVLAKQRLFFKFQPIFDLQQGQIVGYECLARAQNEQGHDFNGQQLVEAAISLCLTREFDDLARSTCLQAIAAVHSSQTFFINVLPNAIIQDVTSLEHTFEQVIALGLNPQQIVFELTEIEALTQMPQLLETIQQIRHWGFRLAIDDLYGNVSSDHYCMEFRPDIIKIDKRLVAGCSRHPLKQILLKSLLRSAQELGILVLAEGLEEVADIDFCRELGIDYGQGFGLALPDRSLQAHPCPQPDRAKISGAV